ncbi:polysaccharide pyruvyl transferase family protein [Geomicrobium sp. JSM 1781026]|uniref:polysaccharide pyruvyl transferase family protein n=1 Tax=Geomicrobium sp. JSM 1781026 TaxID=3344580 RepID=UPI0035C036B6
MIHKYITIVGGELYNKGAQAMTFTVISELGNKYPNAKIILLSSMDYNRSENEKNIYNFEILPWSIKDKSRILRGHDTNLSKKLKNSILMVDISGFALSSQRGFKPSIQYLLNIKIAKKFKLPMYLLPQSFGPFNYSRVQAFVVKSLLKKYIKYPKIYAREDAGLSEIKKYNLNAQRSYDIVLQSNKKYDLEKIFLNDAQSQVTSDTRKNSVAIIPNKKLADHKVDINLNKIYKELVEKLLSLGKTVYLIFHSPEDREICESIKQDFNNDNNVIYINQVVECTNVETFLKEMDFIIASRYHSIIHAYKEFTPALVLGWAVKYKELLEAFGQERYLFQVQNSFVIKDLLDKVEELELNKSNESSKIKVRLTEIQKHNVFDEIKI